MVYLISQMLALLLLAMAIGVLAGWLFFGGNTGQVAELTAEHKDLEADLVEAREQIAQRDDDVTRLKGKLRKAATELESRATQVRSARRAHAEATARLQDVQGRFSEVDAERARLQILADDAIANPTLWAAEAESRNIDAAVAERTVEFSSRINDLESDVASLEDRVTSLTDERNTLQHETGGLRERVEAAESEVVRTRAEASQVETTLRDTVKHLELDLSALRLRAESARNEVKAIAADLGDFRQQNAAMLQDSHARVRELSRRVETAHGILGGQAISAAGVDPEVDSDKVTFGKDVNDFSVLPGINDQILSHLKEMQVTSLADIATWTDADVENYESWLPDFPKVISSNDWVEHARRIVGQDAQSSAVLPVGTH